MYAFSKSKAFKLVSSSLMLGSLLAGCAATERLDHFGKKPSFSEVENTNAQVYENINCFDCASQVEIQ